jgi:hypothetical protein
MSHNGYGSMYGTGYQMTAAQMEAECNDCLPNGWNAARSVMGPLPEPPDVSAMAVTDEGRAVSKDPPPLVPAPEEKSGQANALLFVGAVILGLYLLSG